MVSGKVQAWLELGMIYGTLITFGLFGFGKPTVWGSGIITLVFFARWPVWYYLEVRRAERREK